MVLFNNSKPFILTPQNHSVTLSTTPTMNNSMFRRSNITKAAASGVALGVAGQTIDKTGFNTKQAALQAGCSYVSPAVVDQVGPMIGTLQKGMLIDAAATGALYSLSSGYLGLDYRSFMYKFLYSMGSDAVADYARPYLPNLG